MAISQKELNDKLLAMTQEDREHIQEIMMLLADCGVKGDGQAVMLFSKEGSEYTEFITMNCSDDDTLELLHTAIDMVHLDGATTSIPKEKMN